MSSYALPPSTFVSTQAWSIHRDELVFPSAKTFLPERWLGATDKECEEDHFLRCVRQLYIGSGRAGCG